MIKKIILAGERGIQTNWYIKCQTLSATNETWKKSMLKHFFKVSQVADVSAALGNLNLNIVAV